MFESLVADLLTSHLGDFIEGVSSSDLNISILKGRVELRDLLVKETALDFLGLPLSVTFGRVGYLHVNLPLTSLKSKPTIVDIQDVFLLAKPKDSRTWSDEEEARIALRVKRNLIDRWELMRNEKLNGDVNGKDASSDASSSSRPSWTARLGISVGMNLQVNISNIHIRFEDDTSDAMHAFSLGFCIDRLSACTVNERGERIQVPWDVPFFRKRAELENMSLYLDCENVGEMRARTGWAAAEWIQFLASTIPSSNNDKDHHFLLRPVSASLNILFQNVRASQMDRSLPRVNVHFSLPRISLELESDQFRRILMMLDYFSNFEKMETLRRRRPRIISGQKFPAQDWWHYLSDLVVHSTHRRVRIRWSEIKKRRDLRHRYVALFKVKNKVPWLDPQGKGLDAIGQDEFNRLEEELALDDLKLFRSIAYMEIDVEGKKYAAWEAEKKRRKKEADPGLFARMFGAKKKEIDVSDKDQFMKTNFSDSDRERLFESIGFDQTEEIDAKDMETLGADFKWFSFSAEVGNGTFALLDRSSRSVLASIELRSHTVDFSTQVDGKSDLDIAFGDIVVRDILTSDSFFSTIVCRYMDSAQSIGSLPTIPLFSLKLRLFPKSSPIDSSLTCVSQPLQIVVSTPFLKNVGSFFSVPPDYDVERIGQAVWRSLMYLQSRLFSAIKKVVHNERPAFDVSVQMASPKIIFPQDVCKEHSPAILVDFGRLYIESDLSATIGSIRKSSSFLQTTSSLANESSNERLFGYLSGGSDAHSSEDTSLSTYHQRRVEEMYKNRRENYLKMLKESIGNDHPVTRSLTRFDPQEDQFCDTYLLAIENVRAKVVDSASFRSSSHLSPSSPNSSVDSSVLGNLLHPVYVFARIRQYIHGADSAPSSSFSTEGDARPLFRLKIDGAIPSVRAEATPSRLRPLFHVVENIISYSLNPFGNLEFDPILRSGYMDMYVASSFQWKKKYVILRRDRIFLYEKKADLVASSVLILRDDTTVHPSAESNHIVDLKFAPLPGEQFGASFKFWLEDADDAKLWIWILRDVIDVLAASLQRTLTKASSEWALAESEPEESNRPRTSFLQSQSNSLALASSSNTSSSAPAAQVGFRFKVEMNFTIVSMEGVLDCGDTLFISQFQDTFVDFIYTEEKQQVHVTMRSLCTSGQTSNGHSVTLLEALCSDDQKKHILSLSFVMYPNGDMEMDAYLAHLAAFFEPSLLPAALCSTLEIVEDSIAIFSPDSVYGGTSDGSLSNIQNSSSPSLSTSPSPIGIVKVRVVLSGFSFVIGDELDPRIDINITDIHRLSGSVTVYPNGDFECSAELGSFRISNVFEYVVPAYEESSSSGGVSSSKRIQGALEAARLSHPAFPWLLSTCSADERFQLESIFLEEECMSNTPFVSLRYSDFSSRNDGRYPRVLLGKLSSVRIVVFLEPVVKLIRPILVGLAPFLQGSHGKSVPKPTSLSSSVLAPSQDELCSSLPLDGTVSDAQRTIAQPPFLIAFHVLLESPLIYVPASNSIQNCVRLIPGSLLLANIPDQAWDENSFDIPKIPEDEESIAFEICSMCAQTLHDVGEWKINRASISSSEKLLLNHDSHDRADVSLPLPFRSLLHHTSIEMKIQRAMNRANIKENSAFESTNLQLEEKFGIRFHIPQINLSVSHGQLCCLLLVLLQNLLSTDFSSLAYLLEPDTSLSDDSASVSSTAYASDTEGSEIETYSYSGHGDMKLSSPSDVRSTPGPRFSLELSGVLDNASIHILSDSLTGTEVSLVKLTLQNASCTFSKTSLSTEVGFSLQEISMIDERSFDESFSRPEVYRRIIQSDNRSERKQIEVSVRESPWSDHNCVDSSINNRATTSISIYIGPLSVFLVPSLIGSISEFMSNVLKLTMSEGTDGQEASSSSQLSLSPADTESLQCLGMHVLRDGVEVMKFDGIDEEKGFADHLIESEEYLLTHDLFLNRSRRLIIRHPDCDQPLVGEIQNEKDRKVVISQIRSHRHVVIDGNGHCIILSSLSAEESGPLILVAGYTSVQFKNIRFRYLSSLELTSFVQCESEFSFVRAKHRDGVSREKVSLQDASLQKKIRRMERQRRLQKASTSLSKYVHSLDEQNDKIFDERPEQGCALVDEREKFILAEYSKRILYQWKSVLREDAEKRRNSVHVVAEIGNPTIAVPVIEFGHSSPVLVLSACASLQYVEEYLCTDQLSTDNGRPSSSFGQDLDVPLMSISMNANVSNVSLFFARFRSQSDLLISASELNILETIIYPFSFSFLMTMNEVSRSKIVAEMEEFVGSHGEDHPFLSSLAVSVENRVQRVVDDCLTFSRSQLKELFHQIRSLRRCVRGLPRSVDLEGTLFVEPRIHVDFPYSSLEKVVFLYSQMLSALSPLLDQTSHRSKSLSSKSGTAVLATQELLERFAARLPPVSVSQIEKDPVVGPSSVSRCEMPKSTDLFVSQMFHSLVANVKCPAVRIDISNDVQRFYSLPLFSASVTDITVSIYGIFSMYRGDGCAKFAAMIFNQSLTSWEPVIEPWECKVLFANGNEPDVLAEIVSWDPLLEEARDSSSEVDEMTSFVRSVDSNARRTALSLRSAYKLDLNISSQMVATSVQVFQDWKSGFVTAFEDASSFAKLAYSCGVVDELSSSSSFRSHLRTLHRQYGDGGSFSLTSDGSPPAESSCQMESSRNSVAVFNETGINLSVSFGVGIDSDLGSWLHLAGYTTKENEIFFQLPDSSADAMDTRRVDRTLLLRVQLDDNLSLNLPRGGDRPVAFVDITKPGIRFVRLKSFSLGNSSLLDPTLLIESRVSESGDQKAVSERTVLFRSSSRILNHLPFSIKLRFEFPSLSQKGETSVIESGVIECGRGCSIPLFGVENLNQCFVSLKSSFSTDSDWSAPVHISDVIHSHSCCSVEMNFEFESISNFETGLQRVLFSCIPSSKNSIHAETRDISISIPFVIHNALPLPMHIWINEAARTERQVATAFSGILQPSQSYPVFGVSCMDVVHMSTTLQGGQWISSSDAVILNGKDDPIVHVSDDARKWSQKKTAEIILVDQHDRPLRVLVDIEREYGSYGAIQCTLYCTHWIINRSPLFLLFHHGEHGFPLSTGKQRSVMSSTLAGQGAAYCIPFEDTHENKIDLVLYSCDPTVKRGSSTLHLSSFERDQSKVQIPIDTVGVSSLVTLDADSSSSRRLSLEIDEYVNPCLSSASIDGSISENLAQIQLACTVSLASGNYSRTRVVSIRSSVVFVNELDVPISVKEFGSPLQYHIPAQKESDVFFRSDLEHALLMFRIESVENLDCDWSTQFQKGSVSEFDVKFVMHSPLLGSKTYGFARIVFQFSPLDSVTYIYVRYTGKTPSYALYNLTWSHFTFTQHKFETEYQLAPKANIAYCFDSSVKGRIIDLSFGLRTNSGIASKTSSISFDEIGRLHVLHESGKNDLNRSLFGVVTVVGPTRVLLLANDRSVAESFLSNHEVQDKNLAMKSRFGSELTIQIPLIGLSIVDSKPEEILYISLSAPFLKLSSNEAQSSFELQMAGLQIDNQLRRYAHPVLLEPSAAVDSSRPFLHISIVRLLYDTSILHYEYIGALLQEMEIVIDEAVLWRLISMIDTIVTSVSKFSSPLPKSQDTTSSMDSSLSAPAFWIARFDYKEYDAQCDRDMVAKCLSTMNHPELASIEASHIFVDDFVLNPVSARISLISDSVSGSPDISALSILWTNPIVNMILSFFKNIDRSHFSFNAIKMHQVLDTQNQFIDRVVSTYIRLAIFQGYKLIGSINLLGNPVGLLSNVGTGLLDFFSEPAKGIVRSPLHFGSGLAKGTYSLVKNSLHGVFNTASKVTSSLSKGLATLSMDDEYLARRDAFSRRKARHAAEGLFQGALGLGEGIFSGISGIFLDPIKGAKKKGFFGFLSGVGKGIIGAVVKPVSGAIDLVSKTGEGFANTATLLDKKVRGKRVRIPRPLGPNGEILIYDDASAEGQQLLYEVEHGEYFSDVFIISMVLHNFLYVVTNRTLFCFSVKGSVEWIERISNIRAIRFEKKTLYLTLHDPYRSSVLRRKKYERHIECADYEYERDGLDMLFQTITQTMELYSHSQILQLDEI